MIDPVRLVLDFGYYLSFPTIIVVMVAGGLGLRYGVLQRLAAGVVAAAKAVIACAVTISRAILAFLGRLRWRYITGAASAGYVTTVIYAAFMKAAGGIAPGTPLDLVWLSQPLAAVLLVNACIVRLTVPPDEAITKKDYGVLAGLTVTLASLPMLGIEQYIWGDPVTGLPVALVCMAAGAFVDIIFIGIIWDEIKNNIDTIRGMA